ncbi:DUF4180 domain-containing protein [Streptomyces sp. NPDC048507]|uniref:DUF4180 domain-containing protein n=1 Tax=Streptomyces sp. NPDC048507 TaxID=3365560 RepID=UPI00371FC8BA
MTDTIETLAGTPVLVRPPDGAPVRDERDATDLIGEGWYRGAEWVLLPAACLSEDFFRLRTRLAGDIVQKFVNYRMGLAVVGDISHHVEASDSLRDFVRESNRGTQLWFLPDAEALRARLARP